MLKYNPELAKDDEEPVTHLHIGIAGAGILGRLLAWQLLAKGCQISLFDQLPQEDETNCSFAAAGMLTPYAELEKGDYSLLQLGLTSIARWPVILQSLPSPVYFQQRGSLLTAHHQDIGELRRFLNVMNDKIPTTLQTPSLAWKVLGTVAEINSLEPGLPNKNLPYVYLPDEAQIDNQQLMRVLGQALQQRITWHATTAITQTLPHTIITPHHEYQFDWVFDCRGLGAKEHFTDLRGVRGEALQLHAPNVELSRPLRIMHPRYRLYIAPRADHIFYLGASEIESNDSGPISVQSILELLSAVYSIHPGFVEARIVRLITQVRPTLQDHLPRIITQTGLTAINGLYRHGFLLAPALVDLAANTLENHATLEEHPYVKLHP